MNHVQPSVLTIATTIALLVCTVYSMPPLTHEQATRLETARDGRDHQEEAFIALLENVRQWTGRLGDTPVRLNVNVGEFLGNPDSYRGDVVRISGRLEQVTKLQREQAGIEEWFVRLDDGVPVIVFVAGLEAAHDWRESQHVEIFARFYKRVDSEDRQGIARQYAAFVGAHPRLVNSPAHGAMQVWIVAVPVLALLIAFALLMLFIRRQRTKTAGIRRSRPQPMELDEPLELPDDPAEALAELKRRAEVF